MTVSEKTPGEKDTELLIKFNAESKGFIPEHIVLFKETILNYLKEKNLQSELFEKERLEEIGQFIFGDYLNRFRGYNFTCFIVHNLILLENKAKTKKGFRIQFITHGTYRFYTSEYRRNKSKSYDLVIWFDDVTQKFKEHGHHFSGSNFKESEEQPWYEKCHTPFKDAGYFEEKTVEILNIEPPLDVSVGHGISSCSDRKVVESIIWLFIKQDLLPIFYQVFTRFLEDNNVTIFKIPLVIKPSKYETTAPCYDSLIIYKIPLESLNETCSVEDPEPDGEYYMEYPCLSVELCENSKVEIFGNKKGLEFFINQVIGMYRSLRTRDIISTTYPLGSYENITVSLLSVFSPSHFKK